MTRRLLSILRRYLWCRRDAHRWELLPSGVLLRCRDCGRLELSPVVLDAIDAAAQAKVERRRQRHVSVWLSKGGEA